MKRYCLALDLKDDQTLIEEYKAYHKEVWPEIIQSIKDSGISTMEIYLTGTRLFMIIETEDHFSFEQKADLDKNNPAVEKWEKLMWNYQQALPFADPGEKWKVMDLIFSL